MLFNEPKLLKFIFKIVSNVRKLVSVLFNEPKLLKCSQHCRPRHARRRFSALQRAEIAEMWLAFNDQAFNDQVSVLFNEPKLLKWIA